MHFTLKVYTLGCKVSQYESEAILEEGLRRGMVAAEDGAPCDVCVINTCTVTAEGDRKCRQTIRRAKKESPHAKILVCGCYSQVSPTEVAKIEGVDYICGSADKLRVIDRAFDLLNGDPLPKIEITPLERAGYEQMRICRMPRTRAYVKIEDGCENRCAYCKIPDARGNVRSRTVADALDEIETLANGGVKEAVLTGIEVAAYGKDTGENLADLIEAVSRVDGIERIRLSSLEPTLILRGDFLQRIVKIEKLCPHFHLSMQSGCSRTLAAMRRKYNADMAMRAVNALRAALPDVQLTADFIVGFPGERDEDFNATLAFAKAARFLDVHIFPFSKRKGTPAADMPDQVEEAVKHSRVQTMIAACAEVTAEILSETVRRGAPLDVLFEQTVGGLWSGHTSSYIEVRVESAADLRGKFARVLPQSVKDQAIFGILSAK
ncbi:MAG: tRNA (N(6)-L-threonylcarbamoyladenosine(37)-C(2))-methylthiotransferase MtaB [Clostridia bacterium]|nr:tRNA (N(6)-L-threonylcarbamoyladenosine(37)-C(2))-methylthiotransferase MtaB [Clostridia bacterium]